MTDAVTAEVEAAVDAASAGWGGDEAATLTSVKFYWFTLADGTKFTHLDITGAEALALEAEFGVEWGELRPKGSLAHHMGFLRVFIARSHPEGKIGAANVVSTMTVGQIEDALEVEWDRVDDLPDSFEDGLPKAAKAAP